MKLFVVAAGLGAMLVGISACSNSTTGQPSSTTTVTGAQPTSTTGGGGALPVDHVCSLLSTSDLTQLGVSATPTDDLVGTSHACEFDNSEGHVIVGIRTDVGLAGFNANGGTVQDLKIGTHQAKQETDRTGSCVIGIGVSASSRVDITVTGNGSTDPCPTSMAVAKIVELKLP